MKRPTWDIYFMKITNLVAERSTCMRRRVGATIVKDKKIVSTGYNGAPKGLKHCLESGCLREEMGVPSGERHELCRGAHAEQNAIIQAAGSGTSIDGATMYCTDSPCSTCTKMIINSGIMATDAKYTAPTSVILERTLSIKSEVFFPGLIPGIKPPYFFRLSATSEGLKMIET